MRAIRLASLCSAIGVLLAPEDARAQVTYVGESAASAGTGNRTVTLPAWAANDVCFLSATSMDNQAHTVSATSGTWTQIVQANNGTTQRVSLWWRRMATGNTNPSVNRVTNTAQMIARAVCYRGVDTGATPYVNSALNATSAPAGSQMAVATASVTTTGFGPNVLVLHFVGSTSTTNAAIAYSSPTGIPTGTTEAPGGAAGGTFSTRTGLAIYAGRQPAEGATGTANVTTASATIDGAVQLAVKPLAIVIGDGASADPAGATLAAGATTALDHFNLYTSSGTSTVSQVSVALTGSAALSRVELRSGTGCAGALLGTVTSPGATATFTGLSLAANATGSSGTNYTVCGTAAMVATDTAVLAEVSGITRSGTLPILDGDGANAFTVSGTTLFLGNGTSTDPAGTDVSASQTVALDYFTVATSAGAATVTDVAVALSGSAALTSLELRSGTGCAGTQLDVVTSPGPTPIFSGLSLAANASGSSGTNYTICGTAATVGTDTTVSANASGATLAAGAATVQDGDTSGSFTVRAPPPVATVSVSPASATILAGGAQALSATALPANALDRNVSWTKGAGCDAGDSVSPATTAGDGLATTTFTAGTGGTLPRTCVLTATAADGSGASDTASITVNPVLVTGVTVSPATATIQGGATRALSATALPATATNRNVTWTKVSGCDAGDTISPATTLGNGVAATTFTAFAGGTYPRTCVVRATAADGSGSFGESAIAISAVPVASVTVAPASATIVAGGTQSLSATALPATATNRNVSWTKGSGCDAADSVGPASTLGDGAATATFTAAAGGTLPRSCVLRATAADGAGASGQATVTVNPVAVTGVSIAPASATVVATQTQQFTATVAPANATNRTVGWSVMGAGCGSVDAAGRYTAPASVATGCSVRVTTSDGGFSASAAVTIAPFRTIAIGDASTGEAAGPLAAGSAKVVLDAFTLTASEGTASPASVTVTLPAGAAALLTLVTLEGTPACDQEVPYGAVNPSSDVVTVPVSSFTVGTTGVPLWVCIQPRSHAAMPPPPGAQVAVTGRVTGVVATGYVQSGADVASPARTIDNLSPDAPSPLSGAAGNGQVTLSWGAPAGNAQVVVLRWTRAIAGSEVPEEGKTPGYAVGNGIGTAIVACVEAAPSTGCTDTNVVNGGIYVYEAFSRDESLNWSLGAGAGPYYPSGPFVAEGSNIPGAPMISIVNPLKGSVVSGQFRVQLRVSSAGGIAGVSGLAYSLNDGESWDTTGITSTTAYDVTTAGVVTGRVFEVRLNPAPGRYALRARVSNALASNVLSNGVPIVAKFGGTGDGNLLVRDNSSQLCSDCHAHQGHTSESTASQRGSWSTTCRDCHTPHGTRNVSLIAEQITPPQLAVQQAPKAVTFYATTGYAPDSYAAAARSGPCQVCHTRTKYYRADGTDVPDPAFPASTVASGGHNPSGRCVFCHSHTGGLAASCTDCHGEAGRGSAANADPHQAAAPPAVAAGAAVSVPGGGAHLAHVNRTTWRSTPLRCAACHAEPNSHQGATEVSWSALATTGGVTAVPGSGALDGTWVATPACSNWCHGAGLAGGGGTLKTLGDARWTDASAPCGSCHASPPPLGGGTAFVHPRNTRCASCHGGDYAQASVGDAAKAVHVDGTVQKPQNGCTACHGVLAGLAGPAADDTAFAAMPGFDPGLGATAGSDTEGNTARSAVGVGAHDAHGSGRWIAPQDCAVCHGVKPGNGDRAHANGIVRFGYGALPSAHGVATQPTAFDAAFQASPGCTNYCHSTGKPLGLAATPTPVTWTSATAMTCTSCHAAVPTHAHAKHVAANGVACQACHAGTTEDGASIVGGGGLHVNAANDVRFTLTDPSWSGYFSLGSEYLADRTCASTYCHSNGTSAVSPFGAPAGAALAWNAGAGSATCSSCHGGPAGSAAVIGVAAGSERHRDHVANAALLGANYRCGDCHRDTVAAGTDGPVTSPANHLNRFRDVAFAPRGAKASTYAGGGGCTAVYCHSSGQVNVATPHFEPVGWTSVWTGSPCDECHGAFRPGDAEWDGWYASSAGEPNYRNGGPGTAAANSHRTHAAAYSCAVCHSGSVKPDESGLLGSSHTNGFVDVLLSTAVIGTGGYTPGAGVAGSCTASRCHGATPATWGGPAMDCSACHGRATGAAAQDDLDDWAFGDGTQSRVDLDSWIAYGHGRPVASGNYPESGNPPAGFDDAIAVSSDDGCRYCHDKLVGHDVAENPFRLANIGAGVTAADKNGVCTVCHGASPGSYLGKPATKKVTAYHYGKRHAPAGTFGGQLCWDCHDPHGDQNFGASQQLAYMIQERPVRTHADATGATRWGIPATSELAPAVDFRKNLNGSATAYDWADYVLSTANAGTYRGVCQVCHTSASLPYFRQNLALNGTSFGHNPGQRCTGCHKHEQVPDKAFREQGECVTCHAKAMTMAAGGTRRPIMGEFQQAWSHKRSAGAAGSRVVTNFDCVVCHMEGDPATGKEVEGAHQNGTIELRDPDTGTTIMGVTPPAANTSNAYTSTSTPVSFTRFSRNLSSNVIEPAAAAIMVNMCLKCHDANGAAHEWAQVPTTGTAEKPFGLTIAGAAYTGAGITAGGVAGGVADVDASFNSSTLASYHPIKMRNNNRFVSNTRMRPPWNSSTNRTTAATSGSTNTWGFLITCWDCHAPTNAIGTQTMTVTAHGGAVTVKSSTWSTASGLCKACHIPSVTGNGAHGAGSAFNSSVDGGMDTYILNQCHYCHGAGVTKPPRPIAGQDVHGFDRTAPALGTDTMWPVGATNTWRPFGFMRNIGATYSGRWVVTGTATSPFTGSWKPLSGPSVPTGTATCGGNMGTTNCGDNMSTYSPGGVY